MRFSANSEVIAADADEIMLMSQMSLDDPTEEQEVEQILGPQASPLQTDEGEWVTEEQGKVGQTHGHTHHASSARAMRGRRAHRASARGRAANVLMARDDVRMLMRNVRGEVPQYGQMTENATAFCAGVLQYLLAEIVEAAGNRAKKAGSRTIKHVDVAQAAMRDEELDKLNQMLDYPLSGNQDDLFDDDNDEFVPVGAASGISTHRKEGRETAEIRDPPAPEKPWYQHIPSRPYELRRLSAVRFESEEEYEAYLAWCAELQVPWVTQELYDFPNLFRALYGQL